MDLLLSLVFVAVAAACVAFFWLPHIREVTREERAIEEETGSDEASETAPAATCEEGDGTLPSLVERPRPATNG